MSLRELILKMQRKGKNNQFRAYKITALTKTTICKNRREHQSKCFLNKEMTVSKHLATQINTAAFILLHLQESKRQRHYILKRRENFKLKITTI